MPGTILLCASLPNQKAAPRCLHSSTTTWVPGSCMSPLVSVPLSPLNVKHRAPSLTHSRCSMKGKFLPPTPPPIWSSSLNPAFFTCSPFNKQNLGHCKQVGGPALPMEPLAAHPGPAPEAGLRMEAAPHLGGLPSAQAQLPLSWPILRLAPKQRPFKVEVYFNRLVSWCLSGALGKCQQHT